MNFEQYQDYLIDTATSLLSIDSASGFTSNVADYLLKTIEELGYPVYKNNIGNVIVTVEGEDDTEPVALSAHVDTLGLMVRSITSDGMLMITSIGSPLLPSLDGEYCNIHTRDGRVYTGTILSLSRQFTYSRMHLQETEMSRTWQFVSMRLFTRKKM